MRSHQQNTALILHRPLERLVACSRGHARTPGSLSNEAVGETAYVNDDALIAELAAGFHIAQKDRDRGRRLLVRARDAYERWGATAKVDALDDALSALDRAPIV